VTPLGWRYAGLVWGYAFVWFLLTDPVKLLAYKVLDTVKADVAPVARAQAQSDAEAAATLERKSEPRADSKAELEPEHPAAATVAPKSGDGKQPMPEAKSGRAPDATAEPKGETGSETNVEPPATVAATPKAEVAGQSAPDAKAESAPDVKVEAKAAAIPAANAAPLAPEATMPGPGKDTEAEHQGKTGPVSEAQTGPATPAIAPHASANVEMAALVGTSLGDIILAAVLKDPEGAGRLVAQAIAEAEPSDSGAKPPGPDAEAKPDSTAGASTTSMPRAAE
jgi:H+-transporting ATPase